MPIMMPLDQLYNVTTDVTDHDFQD